MKQFGFLCLVLLLFKPGLSENNFFFTFFQQFSDIAEEFESTAFPQPEILKETDEKLFSEEEIHGHPRVESSIGSITGTTFPESHVFYSIPYGEAPIENLR